MAVFKFSCPFCRESLEAKDEWRGKLTQCPECGKNLVVPLISKVDYDEFDAAVNKKRLLWCLALFIAAAAVWGVFAWRNHQVEQKRIAKRVLAEKRHEEIRIAEEKRRAEAKRLFEEKRIAEEKRRAEERRMLEEKRIAEEKRRAETQRILEERRIAEEKRRDEEKRIAEEKLREVKKVINAELARAENCKTPREAVEILDKLINKYFKYSDLLLEVRRKQKIFSEGAKIQQEIWRAKNSEHYYTKISILENIIRSYPLNPYADEAKNLLLEFKAEKKKMEENSNRSDLNEDVCRWCRGTGKRNRLSSTFDCSFCCGHGVAMSRIEANRHRPYCGRYKSTRFGCSGFRHFR